MNVSFRKEDRRWYFNKTSFFHCGHPPIKDASQPSNEIPPCDKEIMDSMECLPLDVKEFVKEKLLESTPTLSIRTSVLQKFGLKYGWTAIATETWRNILKKARKEAGLSNDSEQVSHLLDFIQETKAKGNPLSLGGSIEWAIKCDEDQRCECLFFMNDIMKENFRRNAQYLAMDTTCKVDCFGMYLVVITAIDQEGHVAVVATGLIRKENSAEFSWFMEQTRAAIVKSYGESTWNQVSVICTDGENSFPSVIDKSMPKTHHMRCFYHILQNASKHVNPNDKERLSDDLHKLRLIQDPKEWDKAWNNFLQSYDSTKDLFVRVRERGQEINKPNPRRAYFENQVGQIKEKWCLAFMKGKTTFGYMATTIAESLNSQLKKYLRNGSNLVTVFKTIHSITIDRYNQSMNAMKKQKEEINRLNSKLRKNQPLLSVSQHLMLHLTKAATKKVEEEYKFIDNYRAEIQLQTPSDHDQESTVYLISVHRNVNMSPLINTDINQQHEPRTVQVSSTSMSCSCHHPAMHLLPYACRHVLAANRIAFGFPIVIDQVHDRWKGQAIETYTNTCTEKTFTYRNQVVDIEDARYNSFISYTSQFFSNGSPPISKEDYEAKEAKYLSTMPDTHEAIYTELSKSFNMVASAIASTPSHQAIAKYASAMLFCEMARESFNKNETYLAKVTVSNRSKPYSDPKQLRRSGRRPDRRYGKLKYMDS